MVQASELGKVTLGRRPAKPGLKGVSAMSFDDGFNPSMTSDEDFKAKFASLMDEYEISFPELCLRAQIIQSDAMYAIQSGTYGLPATSTTLQRLLSVFGVGLEWLISGSALPRRQSRRAAETASQPDTP